MPTKYLSGIMLIVLIIVTGCNPSATPDAGLQGRAVGQTVAEATRRTEFDTILSAEQIELLTASEWTLESMGPGDAPTLIHSEEAITANFVTEGDDLTSGTVSGSSGCNTYQGAYATDGETIVIFDVAVTERACEETIMNQEAAFLSALTTAHSFMVDGIPQLTMLTGENDEVLLFVIK